MLVAIPSKSRPYPSKTKELMKSGVLFVPACELADYKKVYNEVIGVPDEVKGITATRNWILKNTDERWVLFIDDDLDTQGRFVLKNKGYGIKPKKMTEREWLQEIERLFELTESLGYKICGVNTEGQKLSAHIEKPFIFRNYVLGSFMGIVNDGSIYFDETYRVKEDYEISLRHIETYGGILRARHLWWMNSHWTDAGGCKDYRSDQMERETINRLIRRYPKFVRKVTHKASQYCIQLHFDD